MHVCVEEKENSWRQEPKIKTPLTPFASCSFSTITKIMWQSNNMTLETDLKNKKLQGNWGRGGNSQRHIWRKMTVD